MMSQRTRLLIKLGQKQNGSDNNSSSCWEVLDNKINGTSSTKPYCEDNIRTDPNGNTHNTVPDDDGVPYTTKTLDNDNNVVAMPLDGSFVDCSVETSK